VKGERQEDRILRWQCNELFPLVNYSSAKGKNCPVKQSESQLC